MSSPNRNALSADSLGKQLAEALDEIDSLRGNCKVLATTIHQLRADAQALRVLAVKYNATGSHDYMGQCAKVARALLARVEAK